MMSNSLLSKSQLKDNTTQPQLNLTWNWIFTSQTNLNSPKIYKPGSASIRRTSTNKTISNNINTTNSDKDNNNNINNNNNNKNNNRCLKECPIDYWPHQNPSTNITTITTILTTTTNATAKQPQNSFELILISLFFCIIIPVLFVGDSCNCFHRLLLLGRVQYPWDRIAWDISTYT